MLVMDRIGKEAAHSIGNDRIRQLEEENNLLMRKVLALERGLEEAVGALRGQGGQGDSEYIANHPKNVDPDMGVQSEKVWGSSVTRITKLTDSPNGEWNSFIGGHPPTGPIALHLNEAALSDLVAHLLLLAIDAERSPLEVEAQEILAVVVHKTEDPVGANSEPETVVN